MSAPLRRRRRRKVAGLSFASIAVLAFVPLVVDASSAAGSTVPVAVPAAVPVTAPLPASGATLTAASAVLGGLVYDGNVTVSTTAGDVPTLKLSSASATLTGLRLDVPCQAVPGLGGISAAVVTPSASKSTAEKGVTLFARSVTATMAGTTVTWTPAAPPPAQQLGDATLTDATVELATMSAPALTLPRLRQTTTFCTP